MGFLDGIRAALKAMSPLERRRAVAALRELIYEDAYEQSRASTSDKVLCPHCGSERVVRKGHDADGSQRWLCKGCGRTFRDEPDTIITRSKLKPAVWMRYLECFVDCLPLRECAKRCGVSLRTSWLMRMRLIESIKGHLPEFHAKAGAAVQLDETYLRESFKGNHTKGEFTLPRPARHRGTPASKRGLSREQICVMSGANDAGAAFLELSGRGAISKSRVLASLDGKIDKGAFALSDKSTAYPGAMEELGVEYRRAVSGAHEINRVNALHSQLDGFLSRFRGVSAKRLGEYLAWFLWRRTFSEDRAATTARQVSATACDNTMRDWAHNLPPYMDYWAQAA